jgi:2-phospho-L-lactate guanylyltransferase
MILVPIKNLNQAKQRLAPLFNPEHRKALARAMVEDVFDALAPFATHPGVLVVSGDEWASGQAAARNFTVIPDETNPGESAAIEMATLAALNRAAEFTVVFPADIPLITAAEVQAFLDAAPKEGVVIAPASDGRGTNGILRKPGNLIPLRFGNDSFKPHFAAAGATGLPVVVRKLAGIAIDVDRPDDVATLLNHPVRSRAQRLLLEWRVTPHSCTVLNA